MQKLAAECEAAQLAYTKARLERKGVRKAAARLVKAWDAYNKDGNV